MFGKTAINKVADQAYEVMGKRIVDEQNKFQKKQTEKLNEALDEWALKVEAKVEEIIIEKLDALIEEKLNSRLNKDD